MHVFFLRLVPLVAGCVAMRVDRVVVDRDCVVAFSCRVEDARPTALGDEVPCRVDVAVGPSFRGAHKPYSPLQTHNPTFFFLSLLYMLP